MRTQSHYRSALACHRIGFTIAIALAAASVQAKGQIIFDPAVSIAAGNQPGAVVSGDWDQDLDADLAVTSDAPDKITLLLGNGAGVFAAGPVILTGAGTGPDGLAAADFNGDGRTDLAVILKNTNSVRAYLNAGGAAFTAGGTVGVGTRPVHVIAARLDANASWDLAVVNRDSNNVTILLNNGAGAFTVGGTIAVGLDPRGVAAGDFDGDTDTDLAVTNSDSRTVSILSNTAGTFAVTATLSVGGLVRPDGIAAGDLDGDLDVDLAVSTSGNLLNQLSVFTNNGGVFAGPTNFAVGGVNPGHVVLADLDCDGDRDACTANRDSANVSIMRNSGAGAFALAGTLAVGTTPEFLAAADFDGDRVADLASSNRDSNNVSILLNQTCSLICALPGDLNGDGRVNGLDMQPFVDCVINGGVCPCADMNNDGVVNALDVPLFEAALIIG